MDPTLVGRVEAFSITPALPAGLLLDASTGRLQGTPTELAAEATYVAAASNRSGRASASLTPPGERPRAREPVLRGHPPALPQGLTLDPATGRLGGTPGALASAAALVVTASNDGGQATFTLTLTVNPAAPARLGYASGSSFTFTRGAAIDALVATVDGENLSFSVAPPLPTGSRSMPRRDGSPARPPTRARRRATASRRCIRSPPRTRAAARRRTSPSRSRM